MRKLTTLFLLLTLALTAWGADVKYTPHMYQQNDWFLEYGDNTAAYVNPAGIVENDQIEIALGFYRTLDGLAGTEYLAAVHPFDYNHSASFTLFNNGSAVDQNEPVSSSPGFFQMIYGLGYAYRLPAKAMGLTHQVAVGTNLNIFQYDEFNISQYVAVGADVGIHFSPMTRSRYGHYQFGLAVQNALQPKVKLSTGEQPISRNINLSYFWSGLNYPFLGGILHRLELAGSVSFINFADDVNAGEKQIVPSQRITFYIHRQLGLKVKMGKMGIPTVGATLNVKRFNLFRYLQLDADVGHDQLSLEPEDRGLLINFKATSRVGPTREERIGAARYRRLKLEPEDAYREAMRLYLARKFLLASYAFGKVITKYPAFHLVDLAAYYKGKSFENLRMHTAAREVYDRARQTYSESDAMPRYIFQLMNIDYKEGRYADASEKYQLIANLYKDSDVKPDADYVMGQIKFIQKDYVNTIKLLKPILPGNANYAYARYTIAMSYFAQKNDKEAEAALKDILDITPGNISERELQDVVNVKLGHIAFDAEPPRLLEAARFYAAVSPTSNSYDEALLGLSWSYLRNGKFSDAAKVLDDFSVAQPNSYLIGEAELLRGYCYYYSKEYPKALEMFDRAIASSEKQRLSQADIDAKSRENASAQKKFQEVQLQALSLADQLPSARVLQKRDELQPEFDASIRTIEEFVEFQTEISKARRWEKNRERVIKDAKFTKATVKNIRQTQDEKAGPSMQDLKELELP